MTRRQARAVLFLLTLSLVALSYVPALNASFMADDYTIYSPRFLSRPLRYFHQDLWRQYGLPDTFLRPLPVLTFAADNLLRGESFFVPHLTNLLLHLAVAGLVGWMILFAGRGANPSRRWLGAVAGMLLFGLHPQATEAVAWVSGRWEIVAALFGTLGLCSWIQYDKATRTKANAWRYAGLLCCAAALLSKETAVVYVAASFLWLVGRLAGRRREEEIRCDWISPVSLAVLSILYLVYRLVLLGHIGLGYPVPLEFSWRLLLVRALMLPWPFAVTGGVPQLALYIVIVLAAGGLLVWALGRWKESDRETGFPWVLPLAVLVLNVAMYSMGPENVRREFATEVMHGLDSRFSYPGVVALAVLVGWLLTRLDSLAGRWTATAVTFAVLAVFVWSQQYRISCFKTVGQRVDSFLAQTVTLAPTPELGSLLVFKDLPLDVKSMGHAYFFGIGLQEAVALRYHRSDLTVTRWPSRKLWQHPPDNAYMFSYDFSKDALTLVRKPPSVDTCPDR